MLGQRFGFPAYHIDDSASYIASWIKALKGDKRFLISASSHAQRAVDLLTGEAERDGATIKQTAKAGLKDREI